MKNETNILDVGIDKSTARLLTVHRGVRTLSDLLSLDEAVLRYTPQLGAKRYEALVHALDEAGVRHNYSKAWDTKKQVKRETYADEDIEQLPVHATVLKKLRAFGIYNVNTLNSMTCENMIDKGFDDELVMSVTKGLVKYYHKKREVNCDSGVEVLHIRRASMLALKRAGVSTIKQLSGLTSAQIEAIDGIGITSRIEIVRSLQDFLRSQGLLKF